MKTFIILVNIVVLIIVAMLLNTIYSELQVTKHQLQMLQEKHNRIESHIRTTCPHKMPDTLVSEIADHIDYWSMHSPFELSYIQAIVDQESSCWPGAVGPSGELGLMQLHPCNHPSKDWRISMRQSMEYLTERSVITKGNLYYTALFYNGGDKIFYCEAQAVAAAQRYARAIMWRYGKIKAEYGEEFNATST